MKLREMPASAVPRWLWLCVVGAAGAAIFPAVIVPAYMFNRWGSLVPDADIVYPVLLPSGIVAVVLASVAAVALYQRGRFTLSMGAATAVAWFALFLAASVALKNWDITLAVLLIAVLPSFGCFLIAGYMLVLEFFAQARSDSRVFQTYSETR